MASDSYGLHLRALKGIGMSFYIWENTDEVLSSVRMCSKSSEESK